MGYYTRYDLTVQDPNSMDWDIITELRQENEHARWALSEDGTYYDAVKWYSHNDHMIEFSKKYPHATFVLIGNGEDPPDFWEKTYKNGELISDKVGKIVYVERT